MDPCIAQAAAVLPASLVQGEPVPPQVEGMWSLVHVGAPSR